MKRKAPKQILTLAGIMSFVLASFCGALSASAVEGTALSDLVNNYTAQREALIDGLSHPVDLDRKSTNSNSTISYNKSPSSTLLFNSASSNTSWGHDGKGVVFENNNNLVDGNPQLAIAKRGDTLQYSMKIKTQRYDETGTNPVTGYEIYALLSEGLTVNLDSVTVRIAGQELNIDSYDREYMEFVKGDESYSITGGAMSMVLIGLRWLENDTFLYDEDAEISISFSADITEDAPSEVWSRGVYINNLSSNDLSVFRSTEHQATAMLEGNIAIRRIDANGNPVAGAKYTIEGVKANRDDGGNYIYDENGSISEFETDSSGRVIVLGVPFGDYTARELSNPNNTIPTEVEITKNTPQDFIAIDNDIVHYIINLFGSSIDITDGVIDYTDNAKLVNGATIGYEEAIILTYDEQSNTYKNENGYEVFKDGDAFCLKAVGHNILREPQEFVWDESLQKNFVNLDTGELYGDDLIEHNYSFVFEGDSVLLNFARQEIVLSYDADEEAYTNMDGENKYSLRRNGTGYMLNVNTNFYAQFEYSEVLGKYTIKYDNLWGATIDPSSNEVILEPYVGMNYYPDLGHYYLGGVNEIYQVQVDTTKEVETVYATEFLFREKTDDSVAPEDIINPQTSDTVLKSLAIVTLSIIPIAVARKTLSKR